MENEIKIELTFLEAVKLKSAIAAKMNSTNKDTTMSIEYRTSELQYLMQCYDKVNEQIKNYLKK